MSQEESTDRPATEAGTTEARTTEPHTAETHSTNGAAPAAERTTATEEEQDSGRTKQNRNKANNARKTRSVSLTLTVTGTADGDWQAELKHGSTWVARGLSVPAAAVSRAAKELHEELANPIDEVIDAAREQQQARVAQLEAELEQAKQALANLDEG